MLHSHHGRTQAGKTSEAHESLPQPPLKSPLQHRLPQAHRLLKLHVEGGFRFVHRVFIPNK